MSNTWTGPSKSFTEKNEFSKAFNDLVRWGLVYDSGWREWNRRTRRHEIMWEASPCCNCGYESDKCLSRDCPQKHEPDLRYQN
jgi:hypothetical protein